MLIANPSSTTNPNFQASFYDMFFKKLPNKDVKNPAQLNKLGHALASPHWNRLALGVAAMSCQPAIDCFNPRVDKDTAKISAIRTISKIGVCTTVGFIVRGSCYKLVDKFANGSLEEGSVFLTPKEILKIEDKYVRDNKVKLHKNALSFFTALLVMLATNFLIDAPLTTLATNKILKHYQTKNQSEKEGVLA